MGRNPAEDVLAMIDRDELLDVLEGRKGGLRPSKPTQDGLTQYVWRMARFHSGADTSMPVTASWWLQEWLDDVGIDASVSGIMDDEGKAVTAALDVVAEDVVRHFDGDPSGAAKRWSSLIG